MIRTIFIVTLVIVLLGACSDGTQQEAGAVQDLPPSEATANQVIESSTVDFVESPYDETELSSSIADTIERLNEAHFETVRSGWDFDYGFNSESGLLNTYEYLHTLTSFEKLNSILPVPIFVSGPHKNNSLDLENAYEFGHYNPEFVSLFREAIRNVVQHSDFVSRTRDDVIRFGVLQKLKNLEQIHDYIESNRDEFMGFKTRYERQIREKTWRKEAYRDYLPAELKTEPYWNWSESVYYFWIRREIDGTRALWNSTIVDILTAYDRDTSLTTPPLEDRPYAARFNELLDAKFDPAEKVEPAKMAELLASVGEKGHLDSLDECDRNSADVLAPLAEQRYGILVPGSPQQRLVAIYFQRCSQPYWFRESHLQLYENDKVIASGKIDCMDRFFLVPHPSSAKNQAILGICGGSKHGYTSTKAVLFEVSGNGFIQIGDFGKVYGANCGTSESVAISVFAVVTFESNNGYTVRTYKSPCADSYTASFLHTGWPTDADYNSPLPGANPLDESAEAELQEAVANETNDATQVP